MSETSATTTNMADTWSLAGHPWTPAESSLEGEPWTPATDQMTPGVLVLGDTPVPPLDDLPYNWWAQSEYGRDASEVDGQSVLPDDIPPKTGMRVTSLADLVVEESKIKNLFGYMSGPVAMTKTCDGCNQPTKDTTWWADLVDRESDMLTGDSMVMCTVCLRNSNGISHPSCTKTLPEKLIKANVRGYMKTMTLARWKLLCLPCAIAVLLFAPGGEIEIVEERQCERHCDDRLKGTTAFKAIQQGLKRKYQQPAATDCRKNRPEVPVPPGRQMKRRLSAGWKSKKRAKTDHRGQTPSPTPTQILPSDTPSSTEPPSLDMLARVAVQALPCALPVTTFPSVSPPILSTASPTTSNTS